jgi:F-type H+-transporting ATPase subunit delta
MSVRDEYEAMTADVSAWRVARVYAEALLRSAEKLNQADAVGEELDSLIKDVFRVSPDFELLLSNRAISREAKESVIERTLGGRASDLFLNFLLVLNHHDRLELLRPITAAYHTLLDQKAHRVRVLVETAVPLPDDQRDALMQQLHAGMQREPVLDLKVNPDLLGGLVVQVDDFRFDGSVRTRLQTLTNQLIERSSHEIQSGRDRFSSDA